MREALAAALAEHFSLRDLDEHDIVDAAATKYLAQLPEKCGTCSLENGGNGAGWVAGRAPVGKPCPDCHGSGKVYPAELVERIAERLAATLFEAWYVLSEHLKSEYRTQAVAVLDALNGTADG